MLATRSHRSIMAATILPVLLLCLPSVAAAASITIGGTAIADNGPLDLNPAVNIIDFDSQNPIGGFVLASGYHVNGRVQLGGGGALVFGPTALIVNLTNLIVMRPAGATGGALPIAFDHTFVGAPLAPVNAADGIFGLFSHIVQGPFDPGLVGAGGQVTFHGSVNGVFITPPAGPFVAGTGPGGPPPIPFRGGHGPVLLGGGPPWTLTGILTVDLAIAGDVLSLPASAEVGIEPIGPIPEPSTIVLLVTGVAGVAADAYKRRKARKSSGGDER